MVAATRRGDNLRVLRIQLIPLQESVALPRWSLPGFELIVGSARRPEPLPACDAIVVVAGETLSGVDALREGLETSFEEDMVPLLLALDGARHAGREALEPLGFDAVLDLSWSEALLAQALSLAVSRVRSGRGVAAIQHQVLGAVRREMVLLRDLSIRDGMTGLYNFRFFREVLAREHLRCQRYGRPYAVVCFDLDHLRELNNVYGHEMGTRALGRVGLTLSATARATDFTFRIGGDEFASLLLECGREQALAYAERVCAAVRQCLLEAGEVRIPISVSAGIAGFPEDGDSFEAVLRSADAQLYRAKNVGRDRAMAPLGMTVEGGSKR